GLYCVNSDAFVIAYLGIIKAGATVIPINLLLTPAEITYILNDAEAKGVIYHEAFSQSVAAFRDNVNSLNNFYCVGQNRANDSDTFFTDVFQTDAALAPPNIDASKDLAAILYTSGTTGKPKGAMLSHSNLANNCKSVASSCKLHAGEDIFLTCLPMFHAFAATVCMLTPALHGLTVLPIAKFEPNLVADTIEKGKATILPAVPSMYNVLLGLSDEQVKKFSSLRYCISGGAAMPEEVMKQFEEKFGIPIYEGYGPTECSPVTNVNPIDGKRKTLSVGLPIADVEMQIMDDDGKVLADNEIGEICVKGPNVMQGYWKKPEETAQSFHGEWFRTGDLGKRDDEGYYFIVDRIKDMVIVNGMNVYPRIVEEVLYQHPDIKECAVVGLNDDLHGEIVAAFIVSDNKELSSADIRKFCNDKLGRYQIPKKYFFPDELPKNAAGKILKRELKAQQEATSA
ncbi:MAG: long-chain fatty acid--CoA ligase, partial [Gammaproteobacteria bacterium]|nr:long-chain fatty acid--CoA ligase [Gammaproteobacteria bacterium]